MIRLSSSIAALGLLSAGLALSGCMSSPTYGTGTTANQQLLDDLSSFGRITPKRGPKIAYKPRPDLVTTTADSKDLPPPQKDIASASNPNWPESPEERRARLRAEATAHQDDPTYEPKIATDGGGGTAPSPAALEAQDKFTHNSTGYVNSAGKRAEFKRRIAENKQGSPTARKYLSEPPLSYRKPAPTAPANELGQDETKKERERKAAARKKAGKSGWSPADLFSWL
jgi:hypothetical protein